MTPDKSFGSLTRVPLREGWVREDSDFTPWLAAEANIALLGQAVGIELEVLQAEAAVGPFRADIVARDTLTESLVIIENQLERTDHSHLGQTLTYAAGFDAVTMVWIAARFTEEHRAALDWLNRITHEDFRFFGIEIELWRIGASPPAPKFNLVAKPNDWSKGVRETAKTGGTRLTPGQEAQMAFWSNFGSMIEVDERAWRVPKPQASSWVGYGIGKAGTGLYPTVSISGNWVMTKLGLEEPLFHQLVQDRAKIEQELGFGVEWRVKPGRKESSIEIRRSGSLDDPLQRAALMRWLLDTMDAFERVFRPRLRVLSSDDWDPDDDG